MTKLNNLRKGLLGTVAVGVLSTGTAFAQLTPAETSVENTFTLNYAVNGASQPEIDNDDAPTTFIVDRLIDLTVESIEGTTTVAPGQVDADSIFTVTNDGNGTQAYQLTVQNAVGSDDFDPTGSTTLTYYISDGDNDFEPGGDDGAATTYDSNNPPVLPADAEIIVVVERNIPTLAANAAVVDGSDANVILVANTLNSTSPFAEVVDDSTTNVGAAGNDLLVSENVLLDGTSTGEEGLEDGADSAIGTYVVADADVSGVKTVSIFSEDGSNCDSFTASPEANAYSIPGACVEYRITVTNDDTRDATGINVTDILPDELEFVAAAVATGGDFTGGGTFSTLPTDGQDCSASVGACTVTYSGASLPGDDGTTADNSPEGVIIIRALLQ